MSITVNFEVDAFCTRFMCKLDFIMDVVDIYHEPIQFILAIVLDHKNVINEPWPK